MEQMSLPFPHKNDGVQFRAVAQTCPSTNLLPVTFGKKLLPVTFCTNCIPNLFSTEYFTASNIWYQIKKEKKIKIRRGHVSRDANSKTIDVIQL
jgi:hypothetical protein